MNIGYSNLWHMYIEAQHITYAQTAAKQIVCPACREPVLLCHREVPHHTAYLAHYPAAKSYAADCELRVGALTKGEIEAANVVSRGQKLALFRRLIPEELARRDFTGATNKIYRFLGRSKALQFVFSHCESNWRDLPGDAVQEAIKDYVALELPPEVPFGYPMELQKVIALDMWRTLMTSPLAPSRWRLFLHAYAFLLGRLELSRAAQGAHRPAGERRLRHYMETLPRLSKPRAMALLAEMQHEPCPPGFATPGFDYLNKMGADITQEAIGALVRLDYGGILRRQAEGEATQHG